MLSKLTALSQNKIKYSDTKEDGGGLLDLIKHRTKVKFIYLGSGRRSLECQNRRCGRLTIADESPLQPCPHPGGPLHCTHICTHTFCRMELFEHYVLDCK